MNHRQFYIPQNGVEKERALPHLLVSASVHKCLKKLIPSFDNGGGQI